MFSYRSLGVIAPLVLALGVAAAQAPGAARASDETPPDLVASDQLLGAPIQSEGGEALGTVEDVLFDPASGHVLALAIAPAASVRADGQITAIPVDALSPDLKADASAARRVIHVRREASAKVHDAPGFERARWAEAANGAWLARIRQHFGAAADSANATPERLSTLVGRPVVDAADASVGQVNAVAVDLAHREIAAAIVATTEGAGQKERLMPVPWAALRAPPARPGAAAIARPAWALGLGRDRLAAAPRFDRGDMPRLRELLASGESHDFFGVRRMANARKGEAGRAPSNDKPEKRDKPDGARPESPRDPGAARGGGTPRAR